MINNTNRSDKVFNQKTFRLTGILFSGLILVSCGGGGSSSSAPTVSSSSPADNASNVSRNSIITATFNKDILNTSVDAISFTLAKSGANNTAGSVSFDGVNNVVSFTPDNPLAMLSTYTATLSSAIIDLSGNALASNYNWSFTIADGAWGDAVLLETDDAGSAFRPQIAFDNDGNALAVWEQSDGSFGNILSNRFDGTNWGSAVLIETDNSGNARDPQIAIDSNGNALAVWSQSDGVRDNILANRFNGTSWGSATLIETNNVGDASSPQIAIDSNGRALAVWSQSDGIRDNIWANHFDGTSWLGATPIEIENLGDAYVPQIAIDDNGRAVAVWQQNDGIRDNIWANRFDGTNWGSATLIETDDAGSASDPQIAGDSSGNALVVWAQSDGSRDNIWANRFNSNGSLGTAELIETENLGKATDPQIVTDGNGRALAVWSQDDGTRDNIWANHFDGTSWQGATLIETNDVGDAFDPVIAIDNNGRALAVWLQEGDVILNNDNIWANRFDGASWQGSELIETDDVGGAFSPQIAIDSNGNGLSVWAQDGSSSKNIMVNRFE